MTTAIKLLDGIFCLTLAVCGVLSRPQQYDQDYALQRIAEILYGTPQDYRRAEPQEISGPQEITANVELDTNWPVKSPDHWPRNNIPVGQVGGVAVDKNGDLIVFHRGKRTWTRESFPENDVFNVTLGTIPEATILRLDKDGNIKKAFGKNMFYLPHGVTTDKDGNLWVTDVAMHQVMKFRPGEVKPSLTLGESMVPGNDLGHFCKPTDVAVASNGDFFVSDGYCNHRILKFDKNGKVIKNWWKGPPLGFIDANYILNVPHSLALIEDLDLICVADRENGRIMCYNAGLQSDTAGDFKAAFEFKNMGKIYAITATNGRFYVVNGRAPGGNSLFEVSIETGNILGTASVPREGFGDLHDVAISPDGAYIYTGEIGPNRILRFRRTTRAQVAGKM